MGNRSNLSNQLQLTSFASRHLIFAASGFTSRNSTCRQVCSLALAEVVIPPPRGEMVSGSDRWAFQILRLHASMSLVLFNDCSGLRKGSGSFPGG